MAKPEQLRDEVAKRMERTNATSYFTNAGVSRSSDPSYTLFHVRFPEPLTSAVAAYANARGFTASESIRELLWKGLAHTDQGEQES